MNSPQPLFQNSTGKIFYCHCHEKLKIELSNLLIEMTKIELNHFKANIINVIKIFPKVQKIDGQRIMLKAQDSNVFLIFSENEIEGILNLIEGAEIVFETQYGLILSK